MAEDFDELIVSAKAAMRSTLDLVQCPILISSDEALELGLMTVRDQVSQALEDVRIAHKSICELRETCIRRAVRVENGMRHLLEWFFVMDSRHDGIAAVPMQATLDKQRVELSAAHLDEVRRILRDLPLRPKDRKQLVRGC